MDNKSNVGENTDLTLTGLSKLATLLCIPYPLAATAAGTVALFVDLFSKRRTNKRIHLLEKLFQSLDRRLTRLEGNVSETPDIDLFDEIVAKAVSDEDEDKTELYAALVQYWMEHKPVPYEVRLLGNVIRELTVDEMKCFYEFAIGQGIRQTQKMPEQLKELFQSRVTYLGLYVGGIDYHYEKITLIGEKFVEIYKLSVKAK
jgi:hypothetical protein